MEEDYTTLRQTALQSIFDVVYMKKRIEARSASQVTAKQLADVYATKLVAMSSETCATKKFSDSFIDVAVTVYDRMLRIPTVKAILLEADNAQTNPFDCHTKLQTIISKSGAPDMIEWTLCAIWDLWKLGEYKGEPPGLRWLQGKIPGQGGKGLCDIMVFKKGLLQHLCEEVMPTYKWGGHIERDRGASAKPSFDIYIYIYNIM